MIHNCTGVHDTVSTALVAYIQLVATHRSVSFRMHIANIPSALLLVPTAAHRTIGISQLINRITVNLSADTMEVHHDSQVSHHQVS